MKTFDSSNLWNQLNKDSQTAIEDIRKICTLLGEKIKELIPDFTDHSIRHMDALWNIADEVFTGNELEKFTASEAFILGASFYIHDLGMAMACTKEGIENLKNTDSYKGFYSRAVLFKKLKPNEAESLALKLTARDLHAKNAMQLVVSKIPGIDMFIIEKTELREKWANSIGEVSESHHWSIKTVNDKLGNRGYIPSPEGDNIDLGFVACALRIIDYAHINSDRANFIERLIRSSIDDDSLLHWKSQENISGPKRHDNKLKFASNKPINDVEAWWLFYDMASGLDKEIVAVSEYLANRVSSKDRFSLEGVAQVKTPQTFSTLVIPKDFEPVDIRFRPDSIERLINILGGKTLYGDDQFATLRELLQNSRDAILLYQTSESKVGDKMSNEIAISLDVEEDKPILRITDNGIGMTTNVITNYLLGIASDYWNSQDFFSDFPGIKEKGFSPTGKFGIGFLSVFMLGDQIEVQTQRRGESHLTLNIKGLGKHGALIKALPKVSFGTTIKIIISKQDASSYNNLDALVRARAPMLTVPINVSQKGRVSSIKEGWWKTAPQEEIFDFINQWELIAFRKNESESPPLRLRYNEEIKKLNEQEKLKKWPSKQPEIISDTFRILAIPDFNKILICYRGIAINTIRIAGMTGIAEVDNIDLNAARSQAIQWDQELFRNKVIQEMNPKIIESLNSLLQEGLIPSRFSFITRVAQAYGLNLLLETTLPWISIIEPPGNSILHSVKDALKIFSEKNEIIVSYGTNPWKMESLCRDYFPSAFDPLLLPVNDYDQPSFGSYKEDEDDVLISGLPAHFIEYQRDYKRAVQLICTLTVIAKAWKIDPELLIESKWHRKKQSFLGVHFKRSDFV